MSTTHRTLANLLLGSLLLLPGCGYVGFETELDATSARDAGRDSGESEAGVDMDGGELPDAELDAGVDPRDGELPDAVVDAEVDAAEAAVATQVSDYCMSIPALPSPALIDGMLDAQLRLVPIVPLGWAGSGPMEPSHTTASLAAAFRPDGLYVFVRVVDPNRLPPLVGAYAWEGDGVEIYADDDGEYKAGPMYDDPGSVQIITSAPSDDTSPVSTGQRFRDAMDLGPWTSTNYATFPTFDGYVLEAFLTAPDLDLPSWSLSSGGHVGFDISINVSGLDSEVGTDAGLQGYRLGQYFLAIGGGACGGRPYCSSAAFCNPLLVD